MNTSQYRLANPGALIAALPPVLGFVPERSLVVVGLEAGRIGAVLRTDLAEDLIDHIEDLAAKTATTGAEGALLVIVDADGALCPICSDGHRRLHDALSAALAAHTVSLKGAYVVDVVAAGGRWQCMDGCGARGAVDDPQCSPVAAASVLRGRRLYGRREELATVIAAGDPVRAAALGALINEPSAEDARDDGRAEVVADVLAAAAAVCADGDLGDAQIARLAGIISTDGAVRDRLYGLAVSADGGAVETLWAFLGRTLPEPWQTEALVLLAFSAYVRGDGVLAGVVLEAALSADPDHRMAGMLDNALQSGMHPDNIRALAQIGARRPRDR
jgi:hypothetical protein